MKIRPIIINPETGDDMPVHETTNEIAATIAAVHDLVNCQAYFDMPEQKALILGLLKESRYSLYCLGNTQTATDKQQLSAAAC